MTKKVTALLDAHRAALEDAIDAIGTPGYYTALAVLGDLTNRILDANAQEIVLPAAVKHEDGEHAA